MSDLSVLSSAASLAMKGDNMDWSIYLQAYFIVIFCGESPFQIICFGNLAFRDISKHCVRLQNFIYVLFTIK